MHEENSNIGAKTQESAFIRWLINWVCSPYFKIYAGYESSLILKTVNWRLLTVNCILKLLHTRKRARVIMPVHLYLLAGVGSIIRRDTAQLLVAGYICMMRVGTISGALTGIISMA